METEIDEVVKKVVDILGPLQSKLKKKSFKGAEILSKKLQDLKAAV